MAGRFRRGWALTKQSWRAFRNEPTLMVFPLLSGIGMTIVTAVIATITVLLDPGLLDFDTDNNAHWTDPIVYVAFAVGIYLCTFIAVYFNVALAACAARSLSGDTVSLRDGLSTASQRLRSICGWALIAGTVGLILDTFGDAGGWTQRITVSLAGAAWKIASFFVVPLIALEGEAPWNALKRSSRVIRQHWGESATGVVTVGAIFGFLFLPPFILLVTSLTFFIGFATTDTSDGGLLAAIAFLVVLACAAACALILIVSSALTGVFRVAVYLYAQTGEVPPAFDAASIQGAVLSR